MAQFTMVKRQSSRAMQQFISERQKADKRRKNEAGRHKEQQIKFIKKMRKSRGYWCLTCLKVYEECKTAVNLYSQRMQIEENFRDTKNNKLGIGLECANSRSVNRFDNLLLIAALILYLLWCIGVPQS
ncbi:transposase [Pseudoalteromonas sp. B62]|uniref:transposase n=1 Tax=Pseudoalteromonas sp. B62 TaxID=630483 RepID=UPI00301C151F